MNTKYFRGIYAYPTSDRQVPPFFEEISYEINDIVCSRDFVTYADFEI